MKQKTLQEALAQIEKQREAASRANAAKRCEARDDVASVVVRSDGTLLCTGYDGSVTLRMAGWRGR